MVLGFHFYYLNNSSHFINLFRCRKHDLLISKGQIKAWLAAQTNTNSTWMIILDRFVHFQWKYYHLHRKAAEQTVPLHLLKLKWLQIVRSYSWIHSHKEFARVMRNNLAGLSCTSSTPRSGSLSGMPRTGPCRPFLQAGKTALSW